MKKANENVATDFFADFLKLKIPRLCSYTFHTLMHRPKINFGLKILPLREQSKKRVFEALVHNHSFSIVS